MVLIIVLYHKIIKLPIFVTETTLTTLKGNSYTLSTKHRCQTMLCTLWQYCEIQQLWIDSLGQQSSVHRTRTENSIRNLHTEVELESVTEELIKRKYTSENDQKVYKVDLHQCAINADISVSSFSWHYTSCLSLSIEEPRWGLHNVSWLFVFSPPPLIPSPSMFLFFTYFLLAYPPNLFFYSQFSQAQIYYYQSLNKYFTTLIHFYSFVSVITSSIHAFSTTSLLPIKS